MKVSAQGSRASNFELLRIVAMAMIVIHHFIVHILWPERGGGYLPATACADVFVLSGVNLFVLTSGFFRIKLSWRSVIRLWLFVAFYVAIASVAYEYYSLTHGLPGLTRKSLLLPFALFSKSGYWFLGSYFALMLLSPILNAALNSLDLHRLRLVVLLLTFFTCYSGYVLGNTNPFGYNTMQFIYLYVVGNYIGKEPRVGSVPRNLYLIGFFGLSAAYGAYAAWRAMHGKLAEYDLHVFAYNNPIVLLASFSLFCHFRRLRFESRTVNWLAASMLGVYLLQESKLGYLFYHTMSERFQQHGFTLSFFGMLCLTFIGLFTLTLMLDQMRKKLCIPLSDYIVSLIPRKFHLNFYEHS